MIAALKQKAEEFRAMHRAGKPLVLLNAWDSASARIFEAAGAVAVATTSAGIAFSHGYRDGQKISRDEMLAQVASIVAAVKVPVTADVEGGYGQRPEDAAATARGVIAAGAVGLNLEDGEDDPKQPIADLKRQLEKIAAVREAARASGVPLVLNARTDVFLKQVGEPEQRFAMAQERLAAYRDAGADCVFAPGVREPETIAKLVHELSCPLNILVGPDSPSIPELARMGVARVSVGSSAMRATLGLLQRVAAEVLGAGTYRALENAPSFADVNRMMG